MPEIVIPDTSCLVVFNKIKELDILHRIYGKLVITPEISAEFNNPLPKWIQVEEVKEKKYQKFLATRVDMGEASVIALASEKEDSLLILDDLKARKLAKQLDFKFTGSLGVISKAKEKGIISKIKPLVE